MLVGHRGEGRGDGVADGMLAVRDDADDRDGQRLLDLCEQGGEIGGGRTEEAACEEDLAREAIAEDPEDLVADVGLEAVEGEDDPTLRG